MILVCKGTCVPVASPFEGQGGSAPIMHPRSGVPADKLRPEIRSKPVRRQNSSLRCHATR